MRITYRNSNGEATRERVYDFRDYTSLLKQDLMRLITDVEELVYQTNGNRSKEEWPDNIWNMFLGIKHRLLDKANDIARLPDTIEVGDV